MLRIGILVAAIFLFAAAPALAHDDDGLVVNRALGADVRPAAAAALVDGDASTSYCPDGPVVVDLGRPVSLTGAGVTMKDASRVSLELSATGGAGRGARGGRPRGGAGE